MGDSSCSACSRTASYNSLGERERERERGGGGGERKREKKGRREEGVRCNQGTDERCSYIADERGKDKVAGFREEGGAYLCWCSRRSGYSLWPPQTARMHHHFQML